MNKWIYAVIRWLINCPQDQQYVTPSAQAAWEFIEATRGRDIVYDGQWPDYLGYDNLTFPRAWLERAIVALIDEQSGTPKANSRRLLHYEEDPEVRILMRSNPTLEVLRANGVVSDEWASLHGERIGDNTPLWTSVLSSLKAHQAAYELLMRNINGTGGTYAGTVSWLEIARDPYSGERGSYVPARNEAGFESAWQDENAPLADAWAKEMLGTAKSYSTPGPLIWHCARQILYGPQWVEALYETGYGLWCYRADYGAPAWVLIAPIGRGYRWPWKEGETTA